MSNCYQDGTGVLIFKKDVKVTPIIKAIFEDFAFDPEHPGGGRAYVRSCSEINSLSDWQLMEKLEALVPEEGRKEPLERDTLCALLATRFNCGQEPLQELFNRLEDGQDIELDFAFELAVLLDDGHELVALMASFANTCDRPLLDGFGGAGVYADREGSWWSNSWSIQHDGPVLGEALRNGDYAAAAEVLVQRLDGSIANCVERHRNPLGRAVAARFIDANAIRPEKRDEFINTIAGMSIWSYDDIDEVEEPTEGFLDSHCALMDLIQAARKLRSEAVQTTEQLAEQHGGYWEEHPQHDLESWQSEVANGDTRQSYWQWVESQIAVAEDEAELEAKHSASDEDESDD